LAIGKGWRFGWEDGLLVYLLLRRQQGASVLGKSFFSKMIVFFESDWRKWSSYSVPTGIVNLPKA